MITEAGIVFRPIAYLCVLLSCCVSVCSHKKTRNSSGDEIANVNFLYDDIVGLQAHVFLHSIDFLFLRDHRSLDYMNLIIFKQILTRSSATAKSTARPSCLVGVLYDIYGRQQINS